MKDIHSIASNGLVLFVEDRQEYDREKANSVLTSHGTERDCLDYAYHFRGGKCYAYLSANRPNYDKVSSGSNKLQVNNNIQFGRTNNNYGQENNIFLGNNNETSFIANQSILKGKNSYAHNYGLNTFSVSEVKGRANLTETHYVGTILGTSEEEQPTVLYIGGNGTSEFTIEKDINSAYVIDVDAVYMPTDPKIAPPKTESYKFSANQLDSVLQVGEPCPICVPKGSTSLTIEAVNQINDRNIIRVKGLPIAGVDYFVNARFKITEIRQNFIFDTPVDINGTFANNGKDWTLANVDANNTVTFGGNGMEISGNGSKNLRVRSKTVLWGNGVYFIEFDIKQKTNYELNVMVEGNGQTLPVGQPYITAQGKYQFVFESTTGNNYIQFRINATTGAGTALVNNVQIREILGYEI